MKKHPAITPLVFDSYLAVIKNSLGSKMFRQFFARVNGKKTDILKNGELSCAFFVSTILAMFQWNKRGHTTVDSTQKDLLASGWKPLVKPRVGCVLIWNAVDYGKGDEHKHIGFYIGNERAVSTSSKKGIPVEHHWTFHGKRKVVLILGKAR